MIYNVLVVEDEPPIQRGIVKAIEKMDSDFKVTGIADNGLDAVELLKTQSFDLIITDINMPVKDGFYVLDTMKSLNIDVLSVILTGYQEFDYAKRALKLNVFDYLVKPFNQSQIRDLLNTVKTWLEKQQLHADSLAMANVLYDMNTEMITLPLEGNSRLLLVCAGSFPLTGQDSLTPGGQFWDQHPDWDQKLNEAFIIPLWCFRGSTPAERLIIANGSLKDCRLIADHIIGLYDKICPITIVISDVMAGHENVYDTHLTLRNIVYKNLVYANSKLIFVGGPKMLNLKPDFNRTDLLLAMGKQRQSDVKKLLSSTLDLMEVSAVSQHHLYQILLNMFMLIATHQNKHEVLDLNESLMEILVNNLTYVDLNKELQSLLSSYYHQEDYSYTGDKEALTQNIQTYIQDHLSSNISNRQLSDTFGLVPSYIGSLFKAQTGYSLSSYIIKCRMEKAKELFKTHTDILAKDVASMVGYKDPLYFSKVFKKETGIYPTDYRKSES